MGFFKESRERKRKFREAHESKKRRRVWGIDRETLRLILEVSKETYPKEFAATMIARKGIIHEINLLPGTLSGSTSAIVRTHMQPPDITLSVVGLVHSHPSGNYSPSGADLHFFSKFGNTHIIVGMPYNERSWQGYDARGERIELEIVD
jgi:proteasome lid subunit RPN8/RPN11